jgi:sugar fermentation stimulation protein A
MQCKQAFFIHGIIFVMNYKRIVKAEFIDRPNRFIAHVSIDGRTETVHVKNTGRCREILTPGTWVYLQESDNPLRKTRYSLISAYKGDDLINIDSQVPNEVVYEAIKNKRIDALGDVNYIKREARYGSSRFDMYCETPDDRIFIEVKGATLEKDGMAMFPDAPTERGRRHVLEMIEAVKEGYRGYIIFIIQMKGVKGFKANEETDPLFAQALESACRAGVNVLAFDSVVGPSVITLDSQVGYYCPRMEELVSPYK